MKLRIFLFALAAIGAVFAGESAAQSYAITNAKIVTVSGATIDRGTIVVRDGLIQAVGANLQPPADARVFDATGLTVYPGLIDTLTNLGTPAPQTGGQGGGGGGGGGGFLAQIAAQQQQQQLQQQSITSYPVGLRPERDVLEEVRATESTFETARNAGFTTVVTTGRGGIFNGQSVIINLAGDSVSSMVVKAPFAQHFTFTTIGGGVYPASLLGTFSALRQMLLDAQRLQEMQKAYAADPKGMPRPPVDRSLEALIPVVNRQVPIVFNANSENEIVRVLDLIKEMNIRGIIAGGTEAWKVAGRLKEQNVPVLLSLNFPKRTAAASPDADPESLEVLRLRAETPKGAGRLAQAGVKFGFQSGGMTTLADFFANAAKTTENGLSRDAAIRAMTLGAAEVLGIDNRTGSIEPGKIANLTLVKGDLFARDKFVPQVVIDGKVFEIREPVRPAGGRGNQGGAPGAGAPPAGNVPNVAGSYAITIDIPGQPTPATLTFIQQGNTFTGQLVSASFGTSQIRDGRVSADGFSFSTVVEFGGQTIQVNASGRVTGSAINGTMDSTAGTAGFSGTKNP
ncbi:MAG: amidohydrolase family protein [Chloracidobacterium sp.]|nr:amidohydrolase family protein [Chloracidobacterium sp.]